jgi:carbohydrate kinase (thermoresistant glucokinase family)
MILVIIGPMGCGKTTIGLMLASRLGWDFEDGDDYHPPENVEKMRAGIALDDNDRQGWLNTLRTRIDGRVERSEHLILACSALKRIYRQILGINQSTVISVYLKGTVELLEERLRSRHHQYMNNALLTSQVQTMEEPQGGIIVDIDQRPESICSEIIEQLRPYGNIS